MKRSVLAVLVALGLLVAFGTGLSVPKTKAAASAAVISPDTTKIQHVVVIYQENHSFDDMLGAVCVTRRPACNGYIGPAHLADGSVVLNTVMPDIVPGVIHQGIDQQHAVANEWDQVRRCEAPEYKCIEHVDPSNIPNLAALADNFTVSDATYAHSTSASWPAHLEIASGRLIGFTQGNNPKPSKTGVQPGPGWGCPSNLDAKWRNGDWEPNCIPDSQGRGPYRPSPVPNKPTAMQWLEHAGLTWHIYEDDQAPSAGNVWDFCTYFYWCLNKRFTSSYDSNNADFIAAAGGSGQLPAVSFMIANGTGNAQHNHSSVSAGDNYIGKLVSAVENGPDWDSTAIFIMYDDCGCFYDHMTPPAGMGPRNPVVIVSPWAVPAGVDSNQADQPMSVLHFIQDNFGLPPLTNAVSNAYDYSASFDFSQHPAAPVQMTHTTISRAEKQKLARLLPLAEKDAS